MEPSKSSKHSKKKASKSRDEKRDKHSAPGPSRANDDVVVPIQSRPSTPRSKIKRCMHFFKKDKDPELLEKFKKEIETDIHLVSLEVLYERFQSDPVNGLTREFAAKRLKETGFNQLTPPKKDSELVKFLKSVTHGFSLLLWAGSLLCLAAVLIEYIGEKRLDIDNLILSGVLILIVMLTGLFMYYQERKSSKIMASFSQMIPQSAVVIREGEKLEVNVKELVLGDIVEVKFGDRVPADVRMIECQNFKVDNSSLTGENEAIARCVDCFHPRILETKNMAFFSTNAVEGTALCLVVMCGDDTLMGRIAGLTAGLKPELAPISKELRRFMKIVSIWACTLGLIFGISSMAIGYPWIDSAIFIIGIIVANVPEGLLATVTVSLTVTAKKMASKNCLVKNLEAVETLGSTSVICSDKTGTLTQNKMTVCHLWINGEIINADLTEQQEDAEAYNKSEAYLLLMRCATLCNRAEFKIKKEKNTEAVPIIDREVSGDASEAAILKYIETTRPFGEPNEYRKKNYKLMEIPFSSVTKFQISIHKMDNKCVIVLKGAPENVIERCSKIFINGATRELDPSLRKLCNDSCLEIASKGERVLGFCDLDLDPRKYPPNYRFKLDPEPNFPQTGLRFLGLISLIDPPRPQVLDAVKSCRRAGIRVIMVTGDHPVTAQAIARDVGIITSKTIDDISVIEKKGRRSPAIVIPGNILQLLKPEVLDDILNTYKEIVFARTSPTQKLQIVESLQRLRKIVAVTGDGVNDAPALKKADIGIAMGIAGTDVSQESADMILLDDNFASIVTGIEEGRKIFDNLKKSIVYTLSSNMPEILPYLAFILFSIPLPVGILAILCIDILTDMMPAISMAYEKAETDIMLRPPRDPDKDNLVTFKLYFLAYGHLGIIETIAGFFVYFRVMEEHGFLPDRLFGLRSDWDSETIDDLQDSHGNPWTYDERKALEYTVSTAYMIAVVVCQWVDILICKTRYNSLFKQGLGNQVLNVSILVETVEAAMLSYLPFMVHLKFYPIKFIWWLYPMPFAVFMFFFDEYRKFCIRRYPDGYFARETGY